MRVVVGRVGRAHGLHGDVAIALRTDNPELRFREGAVVFPSAAPNDRGQYPATLVVTGHRWHSGRLLVRFAQCPDRSAVQALAGLLLEAEVDVAEPGEDPEEFHDLALIGLPAALPDGSHFGRVIGVVHLPGQDLLEIRRSSQEFEGEQAASDKSASDETAGDETAGDAADVLLVPFVRALVPTVDLVRGLVVVDLPPGLLDQTEIGEEPKPVQFGEVQSAGSLRATGRNRESSR